MLIELEMDVNVQTKSYHWVRANMLILFSWVRWEFFRWQWRQRVWFGWLFGGMKRFMYPQNTVRICFWQSFFAFFDNYPSGLELASKYKNMFLAEKRVRKIGYFLHIVINIICRLTKLKKVVCMNILLGREWRISINTRWSRGLPKCSPDQPCTLSLA